MFKNKIFILAVSILIAITLILTAAFVLWNYMDKGATASDPSIDAKNAVASIKPTKAPTATQIKENTVIIKDVLTNLNSNDRFIKVTLAFELENKKVKVEFDNLLESQIKGTIVQSLSDMSPDQVQGSKGQDYLTSALMNKINPLLHEGKIRQIWITDKVLQ